MSDMRRLIRIVEAVETDLINEVALVPTQSVHWDSRTEKQWAGSFWVGERQIEVLFNRLNSFGASRWRVDFRKGKHQPERGTVKATTNVLNGVTGAIKEFLEIAKPDRLEMNPTNTSREKLYRVVIKRMMKQISPTYSVDEVRYGTLFGEFVLSREDSIVESTFDDARLERARKLGYDVGELVYHGTTSGEFSAFKPRYRPGEQLGFGVHVTPDKDFASRYAHDPDTARKGKIPHVFSGYARKGKILVADAIAKKGSPEFELALKLAGPKARYMCQNDEDGIPCIWVQNAIDATSGKRAERLIKDAGYGCIRYKASVRERGVGHFTTRAEAPSYVILDPKNLRRDDAEFDLDQSDSDDLRS